MFAIAVNALSESTSRRWYSERVHIRNV